MPKFLDTPSWYDGKESEVWAQPRLTLAVFSMSGNGFEGCGLLPVPGALEGGNAAFATWLLRYFGGEVVIPFSGAFRASSDLVTPLISLKITASATSVSYAVKYVASNNPGGMVTNELRNANITLTYNHLWV